MSPRRSVFLIFLCSLVAIAAQEPSLAAGDRVTVRQFDPASGRWVLKERSLSFKAPWEDPDLKPKVVPFEEKLEPGTIVVDTGKRRLFHVRGDGTAVRYGIGVGREGFSWRGRERISRKAKWPDWRPPAEMIRREAREGRQLPTVIQGGPENPLGARALYLGQTLYRIHGTNQPWTIGKAVSSGCIRMTNEDISALFDQVTIGTTVIVR